MRRLCYIRLCGAADGGDRFGQRGVGLCRRDGHHHLFGRYARNGFGYIPVYVERRASNGGYGESDGDVQPNHHIARNLYRRIDQCCARIGYGGGYRGKCDGGGECPTGD